MPPHVAQALADVARKYDDAEGTLAASVCHSWQRRIQASLRACSVCAVRKPTSAYGRDARHASGLERRCKDCEAERRRLMRARRVNVP